MVKIFIGNLNEDSDVIKLRGLFEAFGNVTECDILAKYGFVHMEDESEANTAIQALNGHDLDGVKIDVKLSNKSGQPRGGRERGGSRGGGRDFGERSFGGGRGGGGGRGPRSSGSNRTLSARDLGPGPVKLFIGNLSEDTKSEDLRALFEQYGEVHECAVLNRYGFVHMVNPDDADAAIEGLQRYKLDGFAINVELSHGKGKGPRDDDRPRGAARSSRGASRTSRSSSRYDPYSRDEYPPDPYDRPPLPPPPGYDRDPYGRLPPPPRDPYDPYRRDPYARDPYGRDDPYRRPRDPYERDPYEAYRRDPYLYARARDPYARERDPYARERDPYAAARERDPYARPPPTYYDYEATRRPAVEEPPAPAYDPYSTARRAAPIPVPTQDPYAQIPQVGQDPLKEMVFSSNGY